MSCGLDLEGGRGGLIKGNVETPIHAEEREDKDVEGNARKHGCR